jgi:hypothetical protein
MEPKKTGKINLVALSYYSRKDVQEELFRFCKNRETVPNFNREYFGKRPDVLDYPSDVIELAKKGATSFHCSEEIWEDPLKIDTNMTPEKYNEIRSGWDLLIDIDSKYLDYSKIAAGLIIKALEYNGLKNFGIKFSVTGDTQVLIKSNKEIQLISIEEAIRLFKEGEKIKILSMKNGKVVMSRVYDSLEHKDKIIEFYHTQNKTPIKMTGHHSVFIFEKGEIKVKKASELKEGDFFITYNCNSNPLVEKIKPFENEFKFNKNQFSNNVLRKRIVIDSDIMRLLGYYLSEGHVTDVINQTGFSFNKNENEYISDCINLLEKITKRKISIRHPNLNSTQILIHSKEWANFFKKVCGTKKGKKVPEFAWKANREMFVELLRGYIRGDGHKIGEYRVTIKSVSKRLINEFVWLCKLNGISCSSSWEKNKPHLTPQGNLFKGSLVYMIKISKSELFEEFHRKRNKFSPHPRDRTFPIDGLKEVYLKIKPGKFNEHRPEQMTLKKKCANSERIGKVMDWFVKTKTKNLDLQDKTILDNYRKLIVSDCGAVQIKKIKHNGLEKVYDVSVDSSESFFGGDYPILLHNSGSKGFHLIVPWDSFPKEVNGVKTKDMFPEWPRAIAGYIDSLIHEKLNEEILRMSKPNEKMEFEMVYLPTGEVAIEDNITEYVCNNCRTHMVSMVPTKSKRKIMRCNVCSSAMSKVSEEPAYFANNKDNSKKNPGRFEKRLKTSSLIDSVDIILVAPRHLFRAPYSLHEKTALCSAVLSPEEIKNFVPSDADPLKIKIKPFYKEPGEEEAKTLLLNALDWIEKKQEKPKKYEGKEVDLSGVTITQDMFPPTINKILEGLKSDGRKRALGILVAFFSSLDLPRDYIEEKIIEWNKKNYQPLKEGYVRSQIDWAMKNKRLPPNYDKPVYKDLGVLEKNEKFKNPINFTIGKILRKKSHLGKNGKVNK